MMENITARSYKELNKLALNILRSTVNPSESRDKNTNYIYDFPRFYN